MPELVPAMKRTHAWAAFSALLTLALAGCAHPGPVLDHPAVLTLERVPKGTVDNTTDPVVVVLERVEVEREAPALARALAEASQDGRAQVEGSENVRQAWAHIDEKLGREYRSRLFLELDAAYYSMSQDVG